MYVTSRLDTIDVLKTSVGTAPDADSGPASYESKGPSTSTKSEGSDPPNYFRRIILKQSGPGRT